MYLKSNELTIIYNGKYNKSKQIIGLARTISKKINKQDITSVRVSMNLFCLLLAKANYKPKQLVNKANEYYQSDLRNQEYSDESWFYILKHHPELLVNPLVFYRNKGIICRTPTDILKLA